MLLHLVLERLVLGNAVAPRALDLDPLDSLDVRHLELGDELGRDGLIVVGLSLLNLLCELGESVGSVMLDGGGNASLLLLLELVGEGRGGLSEDLNRRGGGEEPGEGGNVSERSERGEERTHLSSSLAQSSEVHFSRRW